MSEFDDRKDLVLMLCVLPEELITSAIPHVRSKFIFKIGVSNIDMWVDGTPPCAVANMEEAIAESAVKEFIKQASAEETKQKLEKTIIEELRALILRRKEKK